MAKALTHVAIQKLKTRGGKQYEVADGGCKGLRVTVFPSGARSFIVRYRFRDRSRKLTLGPWSPIETDGVPVLGAPQTLASARVLATQALQDAMRGTDWTQRKRQEREAERAAEGETLEAVAEEYLRRQGPALRTLGQRRADLELFYDPLGRQPLDQIRRGQFVRELDKIADTRGPVRADRALSALKTLLTWHAGRGEYINVLGAEVKRRTSITENARKRFLTDDELRRLWVAAETYPGPFGAFVRFTLLTATRRGEAAGLRRAELSDDGATWIIPSDRYKSKRDTLIPLSEAAQEIVKAQPVLGDYVFSADGSRPMGGFDDRKSDFDKVCGVTDYGLHDLRRTARTLLSRAGVNVDHAERCLGHAMVGVRGTYDRYAFKDEKRAAFEKLAAMVDRIVHPPVAGVAVNLAAEREKRAAV